MGKSDDDLKIARLISKEVNGTAESDDLEFLERWLNATDENREIYSAIKRDSWYTDHVHAVRKYSREKAWDKVKIRITHSSIARPFLLKISKYAAVIIFILSVCFLISEEGSEQVDHGVSVRTPIAPGGKGARLIMGSGRVISLQGDTVFAIHEEDGTTISKEQGMISYIKAREDTQREIFHTVLTGTGQEFSLVLSDGTKVMLNAGSMIRFPLAFVNDERSVEVSGEVYFDVAHDTRHPFRVRTRRSEILVLGTGFAIRSYEDEADELTTLVEGNVNIRSLDHKETGAILQPGDQAMISAGKNEIVIRQVDPAYYTTWMKGRFIFRNERLEDIIRDLQRWYRFDVEYEEEEVKDIRFGARIDRYAEVNTIFTIMNNTRLIHIGQNGNKIIIGMPEK